MIDKKWLEDYKLKAESCLELYTENATIKNLAKIILTLVKEIESLPVEAPVKPATCGHCWDCHHFYSIKKLENVGYCQNISTNERIGKDVLIHEDFGCIYFRSKLSV
jgi:hypothetical protein